MRIHARGLSAVLVAGGLVAAGAAVASTVPAQHGGSATVGASVQFRSLHVHRNQIVNASGQAVRLTGFNNAGAEYACVEGWGIFDSPDGTMTAADVRAMASWSGANVVRVPVDEQCWLGLPGVNRAYAGATYQNAIQRYVNLLSSRGFAVILDLAGTAPGKEKSENQEQLPDSHSQAFWHSAAMVFRGNGKVLFDLFNEPWPDDDVDTAAAWKCWRDGGCVQTSQNGGQRYQAVGMQQLVNTIRATGARNIVIAEGIQYAETTDKWLAYRPHDPAASLVASVHVYSYNQCSNLSCYNGAMQRVSARVPLLIGELGPDLTVPYSSALDSSCPSKDVGRTSFDSTLLTWARQHRVSWTAWTWNAWHDCWSLIRNFQGAPTSPYGQIIKSALGREG